jgi:hypothetical protein
MIVARIRTLSLTVLVLLSASAAFAGWEQKPQLRWSQWYRYDTRHDHDQLYVNRVSAVFTYKDKQDKQLFQVSPFAEARRNVEKNVWEREELGVEAGKDIFSWLYLGEAIQAVWLKEEYHRGDQFFSWQKQRKTTEAETRLMLSHDLFSLRKIMLKGFVLDEYTYDMVLGSGTRNEIAFGVIVPLNKYIETALDWRHIDRIHDFDSDTLEATLTLIF